MGLKDYLEEWLAGDRERQLVVKLAAHQMT